MKILFTADVHIKLGQKNVPVEWARNRYALLFEELRQSQKSCELFIIGGDVFDRVPTIEELELFFDLVSACEIETIIYSGNHEALKRNTTFLSNLKNTVSRLNPLVRIVDECATIHGIDILPYNKLKEWEKDTHNEFYSSDNRILCTHVRGEIPPHVKPEIPLELFERWKIVLAGDLHSYDNCQRNILYPGSPVTTSFHRNEVTTGVIILDSVTLEHEWRVLNLPQLIRKTIKAGDPTPATPYHHTIYEIEGDISELGSIEDNELIDKKILKRETDTALILHKEMSLSEEVSEYLKYILQVNEDVVEQALKELHNYADKLTT